jgi:hypothetical protein
MEALGVELGQLKKEGVREAVGLTLPSMERVPVSETVELCEGQPLVVSDCVPRGVEEALAQGVGLAVPHEVGVEDTQGVEE